ncbi:MAG: EpsI family protein [Rhodocyclaceae bacterium]
MAADTLPRQMLPARSFATRGLTVAIFLVALALIGLVLTPRTLWYAHIGKPDYEQLTPKTFGDWVLLDDGRSAIIDPVREASLIGVYSQVVSRTYLHRPTGRRIMLSLAYGDEQSYSKLLHRPESCYSSQGFRIETFSPAVLSVGQTRVGGFHMRATLGPRIEQVSYFIRMGDEIVAGTGISMNLVRMHLASQGFIGDGLLFRTSEISSDETASQQLQEVFRADFLAAIKQADRRAFFGALTQS